MRYLGALSLLAALVYLVWRMQTTRTWIERVPLVLDTALAVAVAGAGLSAVVGGGPVAAAASGLAAGAVMATALVTIYAIAAILGRLPGWEGVDLRLEVPAHDGESAQRWLEHRLRANGWELLAPEADGADVSAFQGGNKAHWDRRARPKRLRATLARGPAGFEARIRVRYLPPAVGLNAYLRPVVETLASAELPGPRPVRAAPAALVPLEFLIVVGFFVFFALVSMPP